MEQRLNEVLLSLAKENWPDLNENMVDIIFVVDKGFERKEKPDNVLFGIGIKGLDRVNSRDFISFELGLHNNENYKTIDCGFWVEYVFKDGYGIIYFLSTVSQWNWYMSKQETGWQNIDLFGEKKGILSKCLSWVRNITTTQVMTLILIVNTLIFILLGVILRNIFIR